MRGRVGNDLTLKLTIAAKLLLGKVQRDDQMRVRGIKVR